MQSGEFEMGQRFNGQNYFLQVVEINAEFVFFDPGGYIMVGMGIDVGVDTQRDAGFFAQSGSNFVDDMDLRQGFAVEAEYVVLQSQFDISIDFAYSGKHNFTGREASFNGTFDFIAADAIGSQTPLGDLLQEHRIGIGLDRIMNLITVFSGFFQ